jgi:hypothetical protein
MLSWVDWHVVEGEQSFTTVFAVEPASVPTYCVAEFCAVSGSV